MGIDARRKCEELILQGRVKVNHSVITKLGTKIHPDIDLVELDNKIVSHHVKRITILLNKPKGYLCTHRDPFGRPTVFDLCQEIQTKMNYAGRLDYLSEGLVLLTNDGDLINQLTHPKKEIKKVYVVRIKGIPHENDIERLKQGIRIDSNFMTSPCQVKFLRKNINTSTLEVTIHEGKKRQIRRMFACLGFPVIKLKRIKIGPFSLGNIKSGQYRMASNQEMIHLKKSMDRYKK